MISIDLKNLNKNEWENLCDNCGRCCLHKLEGDDGKIYFTNVSCQYIIDESCTCSDYKNRKKLVSNCLSIEKDWLIDDYKFDWLPNTCAYKLSFDGKELPAWHHLVSGDKNSVHYAGISIRGRSYSDAEIKEEDFFEHIIDWVK